MSTVVLAFAIFNFAFGFGAAYLLSQSELWSKGSPFARPPVRSPETRSAREPEGGKSANASDAPSEPASAGDAPSWAAAAEFPSQWLEQLEAEGIKPNSLTEATAHVMRLEVGRYREQLVTAENRARAHLAEHNADLLVQLANDLRHINQDWLDRQSTAAEALSRRKDVAANQEEVARELEQTLREQATEIKDACVLLETLDGRSEVELGGKRLLEKLARLTDQAHALRDRIQDLVATFLRSENRLGMIGDTLQLDRATGLPNRIGLELLFEQWRSEDPKRKRELSVALADVDHFARINERLGTRTGDRALAALGNLLANLIRKDRGYDRIARVGGTTFLLFYGDTAPANGLIAGERARQNLEATTWNDDGTEFEMSVSIGVVGVGPEDTLPDVLARVRGALRFAKQGGRDRVAFDDGSGPQFHEPPQFHLKGRVVKLDPEN